MYIKTEHTNLLRDTDTSALINNDVFGYQQYKENRSKSMRVETLAAEVDEIKSELSDIKELLLNITRRMK